MQLKLMCLKMAVFLGVAAVGFANAEIVGARTGVWVNGPGDENLMLAQADNESGQAIGGEGTGHTETVKAKGTGEKYLVTQATSQWQQLDPEANKERTWLGVGTDEAPEALAAQLGLDNGVGLTVTYVAPDSPADKAGLKKNDVLTEFDDQSLVHPSQLRKLVLSRKEGDKVKLTYYRAGKKDDVTVELGKTKGRAGALGELFDGKEWRDLQIHLGDTLRPAFREGAEHLRRALGEIKIDQKQVQEELRRSLEAARESVSQALASMNKESGKSADAEKALEALEEANSVDVSKDAKVTVRSSTGSVKSVVKSDESGTIVIVSNPKPHLTAHDKNGKLIFDGEIAEQEQKDKVPKDLWKRVEPLLHEMDAKAEDRSRE